jgi:hypothetical protein
VISLPFAAARLPKGPAVPARRNRGRADKRVWDIKNNAEGRISRHGVPGVVEGSDRHSFGKGRSCSNTKRCSGTRGRRDPAHEHVQRRHHDGRPIPTRLQPVGQRCDRHGCGATQPLRKLTSCTNFEFRTGSKQSKLLEEIAPGTDDQLCSRCPADKANRACTEFAENCGARSNMRSSRANEVRE